MKGKIIIFSGPSGVGKGTIRQKIFNILSLNLIYSVSATTRKPREGEENGREYFFFSKEDFLKKKENDEFIETAEFAKNYYGTLKEEVDHKLEQGYNVLLEIETIGGLEVINRRKDVISIFILPPSYDELKKRLINRGTETKIEIEKRLFESQREIGIGKKNYQYLVVNDNIDNAVQKVIKIIEKEINH